MMMMMMMMMMILQEKHQLLQCLFRYNRPRMPLRTHYIGYICCQSSTLSGIFVSRRLKRTIPMITNHFAAV